ncbi:MAG: hypothetical protein GTO53_07120 [Planctomycetales bacterium]|nr:hypothetical protein [Planctomycetales bacterium]NIM08907.1 hypothetical protein [Planctomycetales bacterium]NIN08363.1 hypothetical protein [Planctomycetales bacterium]NIN77491.1 hypothetical protein [Planctomycetales bacterium]NIO34663.1 hypothetical protein [Planctomycetales bacterium]
MNPQTASNLIRWRKWLRPLWLAQLVVLLAVAVFFRLWRLDHVPGVNGDEAWMGVQALRWLDGQGITWRTPTGNPINTFHFLPQALLHAVAPPSITLLRTPVLVSGLLALIVNYLMCRQAFDRSLAALSTLLLALLPVNIAYSRFAWDASQSVLFTLPVIYASLLALRQPQRRIRWLLLAALCQSAAILVHPTNVFVAPLPVLAAGIVFRRPLAASLSAARTEWRCRLIWLTGGLVLVAGLFWWGPWIQLAARRLISPAHYGAFVGNYLDLFSGTTVFRFLTGAQHATGLYRLAAGGVFVFAAWGLWRQGWACIQRRLLLIGGGVSTGAFFLFAGPQAAAAGNERYAICLIAPGALLLSLGLHWWCRQRALVGIGVCLAAGWLLLASFYIHYFRFVQETGGKAQQTFRTARIEPKRAVARYLQTAAQDPPGLIAVTTEWWNYWPLAYFTFGDGAIRVVATAGGDAAFGQTPALPASVPWLEEGRLEQGRLAQGRGQPGLGGQRLPTEAGPRVCFVEFAGSPRARGIANRLVAQGIGVRATHIPAGGQRPILTVLWPAAE